MDEIKEIKVSISCITYNHVHYIRQCLDGMLMQQTNFSYEILIHDDASTDGTTEIIRKYESKYPDIIKAIYEKENQWIKGRKGSVLFNFPRAKGKYIALCEGDDYWIDPLKLQKQVDFLEENNEYGLVHTDYKVINEYGEYKYKMNRKYASGNVLNLIILNKYNIVTATTLFRTELLKAQDDYNPNFLMGDLPLWLVFSSVKKVKYIKDVTTHYRVLKESASHSNDIDKILNFHLNGIHIKEYFALKYNIPFSLNKGHCFVYAAMVKDSFNLGRPDLARRYYLMMLSKNLFSIIKPIPLFFLLATHLCFFFRN